MPPDEFDATLIRYFTGQLSDEERQVFEAWAADDPARGEEVERLRLIWEASAVLGDSADTEVALARVKQYAGARAQLPGTLARESAEAGAVRPVLRLGSPAGSGAGLVSRSWRIAAGVLLLAGGGLLWRSARTLPEAVQPAPMRVYATTRAERATLTLPDGSTVMLNNESTLEIPATFGGSTREVHLRGEAYFEVARDAARPFRVHGGGTLTEVLGTKFGVRARPDDRAVRVAVSEGRVAFGAQGQDTTGQVVLTVGDLGRLAADGQPSVQRGADVAGALDWTEGRLTFDRTPLPEVLTELSRWYDHDFVLADRSLAGLRLTTALGGGSVAEAVAVLESALDVRAQISGRRVTLTRVP